MSRSRKVARYTAPTCSYSLSYIEQNLLEADRPLSFSDALDGEAERHARTAQHPDAREAGAAFLQKRAPRFVGTPPQEAWRPSKL